MASYKELVQQRDELEKQIIAARRAEIATAIADAKRLIREHDLTARDCGFTGTVEHTHTGKDRPLVAVKYRGPEGQCWTGRGRAPGWLVSLEAQGRDRHEFLV